MNFEQIKTLIPDAPTPAQLEIYQVYIDTDVSNTENILEHGDMRSAGFRKYYRGSSV